MASRDIHVWTVSLDQPGPHVAGLFELLSADERLRAHRFCFEDDERRFIVARAVLRMLLARYLDTDPSEVGLAYGPFGKPHVTNTLAELQFNLAHSHELAIYAFAQQRALGVDIEYIRSIADYDQIARRFFSRAEADALFSQPESDRLSAFFRCWTRKEAFIKATGVGLRYPLESFDVSLEADRPAELLAVRGPAEELNRWRLCALHPEPAYAAALAVEGTDWRLAPTRRVDALSALAVPISP